MSAESRREAGRLALTDELTQTISKLVILGVPPKAAAATVGVAGTVFDEWMADGEANARGKFRQRRFWLAMDKAAAQCETQLVSKIRQAAGESWQAAAWLAERRFPEKYMRRMVASAEAETKGPGANVPQHDPFRDLDGDTTNVTPIRRR